MMQIYRVKNKKGGVKKRISLVSDPAIELKGLMLSNENLPDIFDLNKYREFDEEQRIVAGPVLVPNKLIPRKDESGDIFFITFTEEDIKEYFELWMEDGGLINFEHTDKMANSAKIIDVRIIGPDNRVDGYTHELEPGSLFLATQYDEKDFNDIKMGKKHSYSIEGDFTMRPFYLSSEEDNTYRVKVDYDHIIERIFMNKIATQLVDRMKMVNDIILKLGCPPNGDGKTKSGAPDKRCSDGKSKKISTPIGKLPTGDDLDRALEEAEKKKPSVNPDPNKVPDNRKGIEKVEREKAEEKDREKAKKEAEERKRNLTKNISDDLNNKGFSEISDEEYKDILDRNKKNNKERTVSRGNLDDKIKDYPIVKDAKDYRGDRTYKKQSGTVLYSDITDTVNESALNSFVQSRHGTPLAKFESKDGKTKIVPFEGKTKDVNDWLKTL